ncbi:MAG: hypothetical protein V1872_01110 [bacterium]
MKRRRIKGKGFFLVLAILLILIHTAAALESPKWQKVEEGKEGDRIILIWSPVKGATGYRLYRNNQLLTSPASNNYIDQKITPGVSYTYTVAAIVNGKEAGRSEEKKALIRIKVEKKIVLMSPPTNLDKIVLSDQIGLLWEASQATDFMAYNVYRSDKPDGEFTLIASPTQNVYNDKDITPGDTYYYNISALDKNLKETAPSKVINAKVEVAISAEKTREKKGAETVSAAEIKLKPTRLLLRLKLPYYAGETLYANGDLYISCFKYLIRFKDIDKTIAAKSYKKPDDDKINRNGMEIPYSVLLKDENELSKGIDGMGMGISGEVMITNRAQNTIHVLKDDKVVKIFNLKIPKDKDAGYVYQGKKYKYKQPRPTDVVQASNGNIYVVDPPNCRVVIFDRNYKEIGVLGEGTEDRVIPFCSRIALNSKGTIFVDNSSYIRMYAADGKFIKKIGGPGSGGGSFGDYLRGVYVGSNDLLYGVDSLNGNIQIFDENGKFLNLLCNEKKDGPVNANMPGGICVSGNKVFIYEAMYNRAPIFTMDIK